jgi:hypothetical protein
VYTLYSIALTDKTNHWRNIIGHFNHQLIHKSSKALGA